VGWANAWGIPRATRQDKPWETAPENEEHRPERGRVTHEGHGTTLRGEGVPVKIARVAFEKTRRLWTRGWENGGREFVRAAAEAHRRLQNNTMVGEHTRREKMCWANPDEFDDILVDMLGLLGQHFSDIANHSERYEYSCTLEEPGPFAGDQDKLRQDGLRKERWEGGLISANPEFTVEDLTTGGTDQVQEALQLATYAKRAILVIPLFAEARYEELIRFLGGHIAFRADAGTWSFVPDKFWKQGSGGKHVGYIEHPVAVVVFRRSAAHPAGGDGDFDFPAFKNTVEAW